VRCGLVVPALMAMVAGMEQSAGRRIALTSEQDDPDDFLNRPKTIDTGRRAEKDAAALAKAQRKRERKAAKRAALLQRGADHG
jgi:hypothetical protein